MTRDQVLKVLELIAGGKGDPIALLKEIVGDAASGGTAPDSSSDVETESYDPDDPKQHGDDAPPPDGDEGGAEGDGGEGVAPMPAKKPKRSLDAGQPLPGKAPKKSQKSKLSARDLPAMLKRAVVAYEHEHGPMPEELRRQIDAALGPAPARVELTPDQKRICEESDCDPADFLALRRALSGIPGPQRRRS